MSTICRPEPISYLPCFLYMQRRFILWCFADLPYCDWTYLFLSACTFHLFLYSQHFLWLGLSPTYRPCPVPTLYAERKFVTVFCVFYFQSRFPFTCVRYLYYLRLRFPLVHSPQVFAFLVLCAICISASGKCGSNPPRTGSATFTIVAFKNNSIRK